MTRARNQNGPPCTCQELGYVTVGRHCCRIVLVCLSDTHSGHDSHFRTAGNLSKVGGRCPEVLGLTDWLQDVIYISAAVNVTVFERVLYHELGHVLAFTIDHEAVTAEDSANNASYVLQSLECPAIKQVLNAYLSFLQSEVEEQEKANEYKS